jgi:tripartite-type tricarboxylate transporter receptor subunit TctC
VIKRLELLTGLCFVLALSFAQCVSGETFPARAIKLITGGAPGSITDSIARPLAEKMSSDLAQPVIVENRPGAGGIVAMDIVAKASPDGYTIAVATMSQLVFNSYLFAQLPYDPLRDLRPISQLVSGPIAIAVHPSVGANSLAELTAITRAQPGVLRYAVPQIGSPPHVVALLVLRTAGIDMPVVPFRSAREALRSVLSGDVPVLFEAPPIIAEHVKSGSLKALALTGRRRDPLLPDTPTLEESNIRGIYVEPWIGLVAPAATPTSVVDRLNTEVVRALHHPNIKQFYESAGWRVVGESPEAFASVIREDHVVWGRVIREAGLKLD